MPQRANLAANLFDPQAFMKTAESSQDSNVAREMNILKMFEAKKAAGDASAQQLDKKISLFTGGDPDGTAMFLEQLHNDPEEIDPGNSYQVMTKLAGIAKKTGYKSPNLDLERRTKEAAIEKGGYKPQSDVGKLAADYQAGLIDEATYQKSLSSAGKPKLTANDQKELIGAKKTIISAPNAEAKIKEALGLNDKAFSAGLLGVDTQKYLARHTGTYGETLANTTKMSNITMRNVLSTLKSTFGGMPTEGERKVLIDVESAMDGTEGERKAVLEQALEAVKNRKGEAQQLINIIEGNPSTGPDAPIEDYSGLSDDEILKQLSQ